MSNTTVVTATVTVPEQSPTRRISIITGKPVLAMTPPVSPPQEVRSSNASLPPIRYASAVLKGQPDMLEAIAPCFVGRDSTVRKLEEEVWILESSEFASCTTGEQVFPMADDIVSRLNRILALYCGATATLSVEHICWINATGERLRTIRSTLPVNVYSSKGLAELKTIRGTQPLGSAVFQAILRDATVNEALSLHGESELSWSQVYDIIEFLGGVDGIVKASYANRKQTEIVRQTANHYRHLGSPQKFPLPQGPPALAEGAEFARSLLKRYLSSRL